MQTQSMFTTYLPKNCIVITTNDIDTDLTSFWKEVMRRYEDRRHNMDQPILAPEELFISPNHLLSALNQFPRMLVSAETIEEKKLVHLILKLNNHPSCQSIRKRKTI